ncbi:hypothetical protein ALC62_01589 [Cyphomyrmex costatus]|uniref:Uncharacterized protein n=1 Tax=Cyphomyrmex costatus TaxID=456900 RepID=A0A195D3B2_9HYME|nr:hypothetical protein ALC62_01589 [Cyphomyrmex costatus]
MTYFCYHLSSSFIAFSMIGFLLELLYHSFPSGSVLQSKFGHNPAKLVWLCVLYPVQWYTQPQNEFAETVYDTPLRECKCSANDCKQKEQRKRLVGGENVRSVINGSSTWMAASFTNPETSPSPCGKDDEATSACEPYPSLQVL